tara:strand:+ start:441 stop:731 length:291 start_codon:yes stop_codon:yes gene_type:complete
MNSNSAISDTKFQEIYIISGGLCIIICSYSLLKLIIKYCRVLNNENDNVNELDEEDENIDTNKNKNKNEKVIEENDIDDDDDLPSYNELYSSGINP